MEEGGCIHLVEQLMEEAARKIALVHHAMHAHAVPPATQDYASPQASVPRAPLLLQTERGWLEKAYHALAVARNAFEKLEQFERRSGARTPHAER